MPRPYSSPFRTGWLRIVAIGPDKKDWYADMPIAYNPATYEIEQPDMFWLQLKSYAQFLQQYVGVYGTWTFGVTSWLKVLEDKDKENNADPS